MSLSSPQTLFSTSLPGVRPVTRAPLPHRPRGLHTDPGKWCFLWGCWGPGAAAVPGSFLVQAEATGAWIESARWGRSAGLAHALLQDLKRLLGVSASGPVSEDGDRWASAGPGRAQ